MTRLLMTTDAVGGVWQYSAALAAALGPLGVETVLAVLGPEPAPDRLAEAASSGVRVVATGLPLDWLCDGPEPVMDAARALAALARRERVDLIQLNSPALAARAAFSVPVLAMTHGCVATWWEQVRRTPLPPRYRWHRALVAQGLARADRVVAPSAAYAAQVREQYALPHMPDVVHNGRGAQALAQAPRHAGAITVGRLWDDAKNAAVLDRAAARLRVPFEAAGAVRGPHGELAAFARLKLLGEIGAEALNRRLAARPVFVSAATFEPFGLAVLEAAAAGCALVLSDIATFRELWDGAALFVAADDADGFAEAIARVIGDDALRARLEACARARAAHYTPERSAAAMARRYRALLSDRRAAA